MDNYGRKRAFVVEAPWKIWGGRLPTPDPPPIWRLWFVSLAACAGMIFMALGINQVTYSNRKFCRSVCRSVGPGFATLGTPR